MKRLVTIGATLFFTSFCLDALGVDYKEGSEYLLEPVGARSAGMGEGSVAVLDGANTSFWNPGAIAFIEDLHLTYQYNLWFSVDDWFKDVNIQYLAMMCKINHSHTVGGFYHRENFRKVIGMPGLSLIHISEPTRPY